MKIEVQLFAGAKEAAGADSINLELTDGAIEQQLGIERVELTVYATNNQAIALYEKLGFKREGVKRKSVKIDSRYDDQIIMALFL